MLSRQICPACGKQTLTGPSCEWCNAPLAPAPQAQPDPAPQRDVYPFRTATQNNRMMSCILGFLGLVLTVFGVLSLVVGYAQRQPANLHWVLAPISCFGVCPLVVALLFLGLSWEFHRRTREGQVCPWCRGRLELIKIVGMNEGDPVREHHEFYYRCTRCGYETLQVDA